MSTVLYPYRVIESGMKLQLTGPDGPIEQGRIPFEANASAVVLQAHVMLPAKWDGLFHTSEKNSPPAGVGVELINIASRRRETIQLSKLKPRTFSGTIHLNPHDQCGEFELRAVLYRSAKAAKQESGKASEKGARLSWSDKHALVFDEKKPKGGNIEVEWVNFEDLGDIKSKYPESLYCIEFNHKLPKLLLNRSSDYLQVLFEAKDGTNLAIARDIAFKQIAVAVWSDLLKNSISALKTTTGGDPAVEPTIDNIYPWQQKILDDWIEQLYPEYSKEDAFAFVIKNVTDERWYDELVYLRVPLAVQKKMEVKAQLDGFATRVIENES